MLKNAKELINDYYAIIQLVSQFLGTTRYFHIFRVKDVPKKREN